MLTQHIPGEILGAAAGFRDKRVVVHSDVRCDSASLGDLVDESCRVAAGLAALGVRPGDVVAVQLPNWRECFTAHAAIWLCGAVVLPIVPSYGPAELEFITRRAQARAVILARTAGKRDAAPALAALAPVPGLDHFVLVGDPLPGTVDYAELADSVATDFDPVTPADPATGACWCTPPEPPPNPRVCSTATPAYSVRCGRWTNCARRERISLR